MAVYALTSAAGSPGVTTTALGLALSWPGEVVVIDADPVGGSSILAGYFGGSLSHPGTLVELWSAFRQGQLAAAVREKPLRLSPTASLIPGPASAAQAAGLMDLWPALAVHTRELSQLGVDVLVDVGRLGHRNLPVPLVDGADQVLLVVRSDLPSVAAAAGAEVPELTPVEAVVVGPNRPYSSGAVGSVTGFKVRISLPWAPQDAETLSLGKPQPRRPGPLSRALRHTAEDLHAHSFEEVPVL